MADTRAASGDHDPYAVPNQVADRLADLLHAERAQHAQRSEDDRPAEVGSHGPTDASVQPVPAQVRLLRAARAEVDEQADATSDQPIGRTKRRTNVKKLANPEPHGRPGLMRRPAWNTEPDTDERQGTESYEAVDPAQLPPPSRRGFTVADTTIGQAHAPTEVFASQIRTSKPKRGGRADSAPKNEFGFGESPPNSRQILDMRVPGKVKSDSPFLLPLLPSMFIAVISTYVWFQASVRLLSYLPLAPILIGVAIGGVMRLGTRSVDFARVIFAVILTALATFWGHAATKDFGPLGELSAMNIRWSDLPRVANPAGIISTFHATAEQSLGAATLMFAGMIAAGLVASLTPK